MLVDQGHDFEVPVVPVGLADESVVFAAAVHPTDDLVDFADAVDLTDDSVALVVAVDETDDFVALAVAILSDVAAVPVHVVAG